MYKKNSTRAIISIFFFILFGFGVSLQLKASIGQSVLNALAVTLSYGIEMKVGTILNVINSLFFLFYLLLRRTKLNQSDAIQILATILNGYIINFFLYQTLSFWTPNHYYQRIILYFTGLIFASISLGGVLAIGIIKFPLESLCLTISEKYHMNFSKIRMSCDVIFLAVALLLTFLMKSPLEVREGTVISILLLSPLLGVCYNYYTKIFSLEE
ncbi:hypothetical protein [Lacrimispora algidixylanolytica]|nr:hypothetical protein [Lacrimispora algidixylanolytica]